MRIHELAKKLDKSSSEILEVCKKLKLDIKQSASAGLSDEQTSKIETELGGGDSHPLKLAVAKRPAKKTPKKEKAEEPEKKGTKPRKPGKVKTAAQVRREAKIKKRKEREAEKRRQELERKKEEKERKKREKEKKKKKKASEKKTASAEPEAAEEAPVPEEEKTPAEPPEETQAEPEKKPGEQEPVQKPIYKLVSAAETPAEEKEKVEQHTAKRIRQPDRKPARKTRPRIQKPPQERGRKKKKSRKKGAAALKHQETDKEPSVPSVIDVETPISIREFSQTAGIKAQGIILKLLNEGTVSNINTIIDRDIIEFLAESFDLKISFKQEADIEGEFLKTASDEANEEKLVARNPIVTFLGHVDHGKTSLLDTIREEGVVETESGGITQHTSAYIYSKDDKNITFIDTPGHEVFTEMRNRGANVTDIVVLVVAADDGVMPQTREAYDHALAAEVPIIVAINKIDLPNANVNKLKGQLSELGLTTEDWGGETQCAEVSAVTGEGVNELLEIIMLETEILELKANPERQAQGVILETNLSDTQGILASVVIKNGTAKKGDYFFCGSTWGRIRHMWNDLNDSISEAGPSTPVTITGFNDMPAMGDTLYVTENIQQAKSISGKKSVGKAAAHIPATHISMATIFDSISKKDLKELNIIIKADGKGSVEAILNGIEDIGTQEVTIKTVHTGVGGINESDVMLAEASDAIIIGFHVSPEMKVDELANSKGVEIRRYHVIYEIFNDLEDALNGMLEPEEVEEITGKAEVRQTFNISGLGTVAGCFVLDGFIKKSSNIRVLRDSIEIYDGSIDSLKRIKDDVSEVKEKFECGIKIEDFDDVKRGDIFEAYEIKKIKRTISSGKKE